MFLFVQVEELAVNLWNWAVIQKEDLIISEEQIAKCT
jgi:hypothetical protein